MASTAWTATREELVKELAKARAEREIAVAKAQAVIADHERRRAQARIREQNYRDRVRTRVVAEAIDQLAKAARLIESIPPDPNAKKHRADLLAALKEKP